MFSLLKADFFITGRSKIDPVPTDTVLLFNSTSKIIEDLMNKLEITLNEMQNRHENERQRLKKLQDGTYEVLLKMYPDLPIYDTTMPDRYERRIQVPAHYKSNMYVYEDSSDDDNSENDGPIDYKFT